MEREIYKYATSKRYGRPLFTMTKEEKEWKKKVALCNGCHDCHAQQLHNTVFVDKSGGMFVIFSPIAQKQATFNIIGCRRPLKEFEQRFLLEGGEFRILAHVENHFN